MLAESYHHRDHLGSLRMVTDDAGREVAGGAVDYYPYGLEIVPPGFARADASMRKYTGHERDEASGLDYMMMRYKPVQAATFTSADPVDDVSYMLPRTWHKYSYVRGLPLSFTDPFGLEANNVLVCVPIFVGMTWVGEVCLDAVTATGIDPGPAHYDIGLPDPLGGSDVDFFDPSDLPTGVDLSRPGRQGSPGDGRTSAPRKLPVPGSCEALFLRRVGELMNPFATDPALMDGVTLAPEALEQVGSQLTATAEGAYIATRGLGKSFRVGLVGSTYKAGSFLKKAGPIVALLAFDVSIGDALWKELKAYNNGECRALVDYLYR